MKKTVLLVALSACFAVLASTSTAVAADKWLGTWKLNVAESKFSPGPAPKSQTLKFEAVKDGIKLTSHTVDAEGKKKEGGYVSKFDGKEVPWKGNDDADTASARRNDENSYDNTWKRDGKTTIVAKVTVSSDGKTLTIVQIGLNAKGQTVSNTAVFTKQ